MHTYSNIYTYVGEHESQSWQFLCWNKKEMAYEKRYIFSMVSFRNYISFRTSLERTMKIKNSSHILGINARNNCYCHTKIISCVLLLWTCTMFSTYFYFYFQRIILKFVIYWTQSCYFLSGNGIVPSSGSHHHRYLG